MEDGLLKKDEGKYFLYYDEQKYLFGYAPLVVPSTGIPIILDLSLNGSYINMFMLPMLRLLEKQKDLLTDNYKESLLQIFEKLTKDHKYMIESELRLFKRVHSPVFMLGWHIGYFNYYNVTAENYYTVRNDCGDMSEHTKEGSQYKDVYQTRIKSLLTTSPLTPPQQERLKIASIKMGLS